jgi:hypothetical protein
MGEKICTIRRFINCMLTKYDVSDEIKADKGERGK